MLLVPEAVGPEDRRYTARAAPAHAVSDAFAREWQALARDAAEPNAFYEPWFVRPAMDTLAGATPLWLVDVRHDGGALVGILPLTIAPRYGRIPARHTANWMHFQCFMGTPLVRQREAAAFWRAVLALLDRSAWAQGFLSVSGLLEDGPVHAGLAAAARASGRPCPIVHRHRRAALSSDLSPEAYLETHVRAKKRKELRRLAKRLADQGNVRFATLSGRDELDSWIETFLSLEASGWKGHSGSAFANTESSSGFFRAVVRGAFEAGRLDFQRLDVDGRTIAMLVNFRTPPGSWSFKIAYDEDWARYSPGVLIELENLPRVLADREIDWMDSCAIEDHPMINSLWGERRSIVQVSVPLSGLHRSAVFRACRILEQASAARRALTGGRSRP